MYSAIDFVVVRLDDRDGSEGAGNERVMEKHLREFAEVITGDLQVSTCEIGRQRAEVGIAIGKVHDISPREMVTDLVK